MCTKTLNQSQNHICLIGIFVNDCKITTLQNPPAVCHRITKPQISLTSVLQTHTNPHIFVRSHSLLTNNTNQSPKLSFQVQKCRASCHKQPASFSESESEGFYLFMSARCRTGPAFSTSELLLAVPHLCCMMGVFIAKDF